MQDATQPTGQVKRRFSFRGAAATLWHTLNPHGPRPLRPDGCEFEGAIEILLEGPAGTGKTTAVLGIVCDMCSRFPGLRVLALRETRKSLSESVLRTLEEEVLPPGSPVLLASTAGREHRNSYDWPNGSTIVPGGMDNIERYRSSEWDIVLIFEATEIQDEDDWQKLLRALRAKGLPNQRRFIIADTNPDHPMHWLNLRAKAGKMVRICARHTDNPLYFTDTGEPTAEGRAYMATLGNMTGHVRARLLEGKWVAAEGMIWPEWNTATHVVRPSLLVDRLAFRTENTEAKQRRVMYYAGGIDWGYYPGAGTMYVGAVDDHKRLHIIHEEYRVKRDVNEWIACAQRLMRKWPIEAFAADPAEPGYIDMFRASGIPTRAADNDVTAGIARVRHRMKGGEQWGGPGIFWVEGANESPDPLLASERRPVSFLDEVWQYCYRPYKPGEPIREEPDPRCADHGADGIRYLTGFVDRHDFSGSRSDPGWPEGSYGAHDNMPEWGWQYMPGAVRGEAAVGGA